jgi:hypothetical protein
MWLVFSNVLSAAAFILSIVACWLSVRSANRAQELREALKVSPVSRIKSLETSLADTQGALEEVANRVKMMRVRNAANHTETSGPKPGQRKDEPDPYSDPDGWRQAMNAKLARAKVGL